MRWRASRKASAGGTRGCLPGRKAGGRAGAGGGDGVAGVEKGIGGGNLVLHAETQAAGLAAAGRAAGVLAALPNVIAPFPGGVCRSASKVGARSKNLIASTDESYCPTLGEKVVSQLVEGANCAYEIVIDGVDLAVVRGAMRGAIEAPSGTARPAASIT